MSQQVRVRSRWWYLLPIFFDIIGGVIAYFILRDDDPKKAKNCLWLGIVLIAVEIGLFIIFVSICTSIEPCADFHNQFMRGMEEYMEPEDMMQSTQQMQQMMQDPQQMQQMMQMMTQNPEHMKEWMVQDPQHVQQMSEIMKENHDFMMEMMMVMIEDPNLRLQMIGHMTENQEAMQQMMQMMGSGMQGQDMMSPITDYVTLIDQLHKSGANVEPAGTIDQPFFSVVGKSILVNGENVQVFEYSTQAEAEEDASNVSPDGHSIGLSMPLWVEAPHFYQKEKIIVLYVGDDPSTIAVLASVLGTQFAGR